MVTERGKNGYLLMDSRGGALARGVLESDPNQPTMQVRVIGDKIEEVMAHEDLQLIAVEEGSPNLIGRIIRRRGDRLLLKKLKILGAEARQNFRMSAQFESFIYPITGSWTGRRRIEANDLSCGGIAFFCSEPLEEGEELEVVIPVTEEPLVLRCIVLRQRLSGGDTPLYATEFVDLCYDEERLVREAVFSLQLRGRPCVGSMGN